MENINFIIKYAKSIVEKEIDALEKLKISINEEFAKVVFECFNCQGKIILTGIGKSGLVCQKIASTLSSTGSPALFLHPAEAIHGDVGVVGKDDVVIAVSNSGETKEIITIIPTLKLLAKSIIGITSNKDSKLAKLVDHLVVLNINEEADHLNIAPSCSSTATLCFGDALAFTLSKMRDFKYEDFAIRHPGGLIGKKLTLKIKDLMHTGEAIPKVTPETEFKEIIYEMSNKRLGCTGVFNNENLVGIITDGDLRRAIERFEDRILKVKAKDIMTENPKIINENERALNGLIKMEKYAITTLFVENDNKKITGIIHLHDILKSGLRL